MGLYSPLGAVVIRTLAAARGLKVVLPYEAEPHGPAPPSGADALERWEAPADPGARKVWEAHEVVLYGEKDADDDVSKMNVRVGIGEDPADSEKVLYIDLGTRGKVDGCKTVTIPKGTAVYKWIPNYDSAEDARSYLDGLGDRQIWCGSYRTSSLYAKSNYGPIAAYRTRRPLRLVVFDADTIGAIAARAPPEIEAICADLFGHGAGLGRVEALALRRGRDGVLYEGSRRCRGDEALLMYGTTEKWRYRPQQHELYEYVIKTYGLDGTLLPQHYNPVRSACHPEEITLPASALEEDRGDPRHWVHWGLDLDRVAGPRREFAPRSGAFAKFFRAADWYFSRPPRFPPVPAPPPRPAAGVRVVSCNLHGLASVNAKVEPEEMLARFAELARALAPDAVVVQELPAEWVGRAAAAFGAEGVVAVKNGGRSLVVAAFTRRPVEAVRVPGAGAVGGARGSIILRLGAYRVQVVHAPIGERYVRNYALLNGSAFSEVYERNVQARSRYFADLPDSDALVGDFNCEPDSAEARALGARGLARATPPGDPPTSIYGGRVDHAWVRPGARAAAHVVGFQLSDHRPIVLDLGVCGRCGKRR